MEKIFKIDINFKPTKVHEFILSALLLIEPDSFDDLVAAVRLIKETGFRYIDLLKIAVKGAIDRDSLFWLAKNIYPGTLPRMEVEREFYFLARIGLVSKIFFPHAANSAAGETVRQFTLSLTEEGRRVADLITNGRKLILRPSVADRATVFIASALEYEDVDKLFQAELHPLCSELGYTPLRVDRVEPDQTITKAISDGIREAACVIADLTYARPSVYFEVGLAHGLGVPLILTCRQDHHRGSEMTQKVHFDLEQYKISYWVLEENGRFRWGKHSHPKKRLEALIGARDKNIGQGSGAL